MEPACARYDNSNLLYSSSTSSLNAKKCVDALGIDSELTVLQHACKLHRGFKTCVICSTILLNLQIILINVASLEPGRWRSQRLLQPGPSKQQPTEVSTAWPAMHATIMACQACWYSRA